LLRLPAQKFHSAEFANRDNSFLCTSSIKNIVFSRCKDKKFGSYKQILPFFNGFIFFRYLCNLIQINMLATRVNPRYITDNTGRKISVVLPMKDFKTIMEELEELENIRLYDEAKKEDTGERILFSDYLKNRKLRNA